MSVTKVTDAMRNVTQVDAAKITTGTIPDARIQASAVTAHVDLSAVRQDIAMLALYNAVSDNRAAYNLPFSFIDQFEDDTGLTTQTNVDRDASGEYVASVYSSFGTPAYSTGDRSSYITPSLVGITLSSGNISNLIDGDTSSNNQFDWTPSSIVAGDSMRYVFSSTKNITEFKYYSGSGGSTAPYMGDWKWQGSNDGSSWTDIGASFNIRQQSSPTTYTELSVNTNGYTQYQMVNVTPPDSNGNPWHKEIEFKEASATSVDNATGTLISDTQTAPVATTKMSGVILYKDNAGTATLGTDLVISLSADNGSNWTEAASYGTVTPLFSTGVKMVRLGETTVTSGTAPVIKAVWANQSSGSKETQLHGWAMNY
jgi:hypothetical protein